MTGKGEQRDMWPIELLPAEHDWHRGVHARKLDPHHLEAHPDPRPLRRRALDVHGDLIAEIKHGTRPHKATHGYVEGTHLGSPTTGG